MKIINETYPPREQQIGFAFAIQPIIQILDYYGNPLKDKYVVALSYPEPDLDKSSMYTAQNAFFDGFEEFLHYLKIFFF